MFLYLRRLISFVRSGGHDHVGPVRVVPTNITTGNLLHSRRCLVTGGSSGIGLEIAKRFVANGASVVITGRSPQKLDKAIASISSPLAHPLVWDVQNLSVIEENISQVKAMLGGEIDILVNNAGVASRQAFGELTTDVWDSTMCVNLKGPVFLTQCITNEWISTSHCGVILNISSFAGKFPADDAYSASKLALSACTRGIAKQVSKYGIRVNAIEPGVIVGTEIKPPQSLIKPDGDLYSSWIPAGRYGVPSEIAELALFLCSDSASYITGQCIPCDGFGAN